MFVQDDRLVFDYNAFGDHTVVDSDVPVPEGDSTLTARFRRGDGVTGSVEVAVDGVDAGRGETALYMRMISSVGSSIGYDHGSAVSRPLRRALRLHRHPPRGRGPAGGQGRRPDAAEASAASEMSRQ